MNRPSTSIEQDAWEMWEPEPPTPAELRDQMEQAYQKRLDGWEEAHNAADQLGQQDSLTPKDIGC